MVAVPQVVGFDADRFRRTRKPLSVYHCRTCDGWHVGTTPDLNRNYRRILEREPTLLLEVGKRALAQMFSESHGPTAHDRRRAITVRARHPISTPENRSTLNPEHASRAMKFPTV